MQVWFAPKEARSAAWMQSVTRRHGGPVSCARCGRSIESAMRASRRSRLSTRVRSPVGSLKPVKNRGVGGKHVGAFGWISSGRAVAGGERL